MAEPAEVLLVARRFRVVRQFESTRGDGLHAREFVEHPGAVTILPLLGDGSVVLIRNRRTAVGGAWLVELPAGTLEPGEEPRATAERELAEETGYRAQDFKPLCEFHTSPGILSERMHLFLATGLTPIGKTSLDPGELIELLITPWAEALAMVDRGEIQDGKTLVGLLLYERRRQQSFSHQ